MALFAKIWVRSINGRITYLEFVFNSYENIQKAFYKVVQTGFYVEIVTYVTKRVYVANKSFCCICCSVRV